MPSADRRDAGKAGEQRRIPRHRHRPRPAPAPARRARSSAPAPASRLARRDGCLWQTPATATPRRHAAHASARGECAATVMTQCGRSARQCAASRARAFRQMQTMQRVRQHRIVRGQQDQAMGLGAKAPGPGRGGAWRRARARSPGLPCGKARAASTGSGRRSSSVKARSIGQEPIASVLAQRPRPGRATIKTPALRRAAALASFAAVMSIPENLAAILARIDAARKAAIAPAPADQAGRGQQDGAVRPVSARPSLAGQRLFGENRVQEAQGKFPPLKAEFPDLELHLIGPLQTNKARRPWRCSMSFRPWTAPSWPTPWRPNATDRANVRACSCR